MCKIIVWRDLEKYLVLFYSFLSFLFENTNYYICTSNDEGFCFHVYDALNHGSTVLAMHLPIFEELYSDNENIIVFESEEKIINYVEKL